MRMTVPCPQYGGLLESQSYCVWITSRKRKKINQNDMKNGINFKKRHWLKSTKEWVPSEQKYLKRIKIYFTIEIGQAWRTNMETWKLLNNNKRRNSYKYLCLLLENWCRLWTLPTMFNTIRLAPQTCSTSVAWWAW